MPADLFLHQAIFALQSADGSDLKTLADCAFSVGPPVSRERYERNRNIFAALLEATGRNLRLLRRAAGRRQTGF